MDKAEIQVSDLKHKEAKNNQSEQQEEKGIWKKKSEGSISSLWDNIKRFNIHIIGVPEGEEKEQEIENLFEKIVKENLPNLVKEIDMQNTESTKQDECKEAHSQDTS